MAADEERRRAAAKDGGGEVDLKKVAGQASLDTLVVASKLKDYIRDRAAMSTSDRAVGYLSDHLRGLLDEAARIAGRDGRRTVMDRDVLPLVAKGFESLATGAGDPDDRPGDVLVVASKVKLYVKARASMATSDSVLEVLSAHVRRLARQAIRRAGTDDRKTVLDRDFVGAVAKRAP